MYNDSMTVDVTMYWISRTIMTADVTASLFIYVYFRRQAY